MSCPPAADSGLTPPMLYREAGQFKASYAEDARIFPIRQDRIGFWVLMLVFGVAVPAARRPVLAQGDPIPVLIFSPAALGLNILTGYAGQLSPRLGGLHGGGAFAAYNFILRIDGMPFLVALVLARADRGGGGHPVRAAQPAHQGLLPGGGDPGGAVLHRLGAGEVSVVLQQLVVRRRHRPGRDHPRLHLRTPESK